MKYTKMFYGNQYIGKFSLNSKKTLREKIVLYIKYYLWQSAKIMIIAWLVVGGIKVGQHFTPVKTVMAEKTVTIEVKGKAAVMDRIAICESGGKHYAPSGQVIMRSNTNNSVDVGKYQINSI